MSIGACDCRVRDLLSAMGIYSDRKLLWFIVACLHTPKLLVNLVNSVIIRINVLLIVVIFVSFSDHQYHVLLACEEGVGH